MSQKGDLYFANVEEQDSRNDYCCFAAFPRLRTIVQKMPMKLTVNSCESGAPVVGLSYQLRALASSCSPHYPIRPCGFWVPLRDRGSP